MFAYLWQIYTIASYAQHFWAECFLPMNENISLSHKPFPRPSLTHPLLPYSSGSLLADPLEIPRNCSLVLMPPTTLLSAISHQRKEHFDPLFSLSSELATQWFPLLTSIITSDSSYSRYLYIYLLSKPLSIPIPVSYTPEQVDASTVTSSFPAIICHHPHSRRVFLQFFLTAAFDSLISSQYTHQHPQLQTILSSLSICLSSYTTTTMMHQITILDFY